MPAANDATPPANVYESNGQLSIVVPVPGAHAEHTAVHLEPDRLDILAECKYPQEDQRYLRRDWQVGSWRLDLPLPRRVDPAGARATLNLGVLVVMAPLSSSAAVASDVAVE